MLRIIVVGNRRDKYLLNHSIHIYSHLSQQTGNIHAKRSYQLLNIFLCITICTTNHSIVIKQYEIRLDQEIEKIHSLASFPLPLNSKGNELFQQRSPSRAHIPGTTATHPSRRRREERERERGAWSFDDYPKLLPRCCRAFVPDATRGETRQRRPRLPADPYYGRHCAFLPRTSQKAEGSCSRIVISGARTALSP